MKLGHSVDMPGDAVTGDGHPMTMTPPIGQGTPPPEAWRETPAERDIAQRAGDPALEDEWTRLVTYVGKGADGAMWARAVVVLPDGTEHPKHRQDVRIAAHRPAESALRLAADLLRHQLAHRRQTPRRDSFDRNASASSRSHSLPNGYRTR